MSVNIVRSFLIVISPIAAFFQVISSIHSIHSSRLNGAEQTAMLRRGMRQRFPALMLMGRRGMCSSIKSDNEVACSLLCACSMHESLHVTLFPSVTHTTRSVATCALVVGEGADRTIDGDGAAAH